MNSEDLMRLGPAAQKQVMEKMRKPSKYKAQKNSMERSKIPPALCEHIVDICEGGMMTCKLG